MTHSIHATSLLSRFAQTQDPRKFFGNAGLDSKFCSHSAAATVFQHALPEYSPAIPRSRKMVAKALITLPS